MAKDNGVSRARNWVSIFIGVVILISIGVTMVLAWGEVGNKVSALDTKVENKAESNTEKHLTIMSRVNVVKVEGCDPAKKNTLDVALAQKDIATIQSQFKLMREEQDKGFKSILDRLPEK